MLGLASLGLLLLPFRVCTRGLGIAGAGKIREIPWRERNEGSGERCETRSPNAGFLKQYIVLCVRIWGRLYTRTSASPQCSLHITSEVAVNKP